MSPLLEQFLSEAREFLQGIGEKLMQLESSPDDASLMNELFRLVHTLKGNSGLFEFPEMTRVLHAGEDLMDAVRNGSVAYSQHLADRLLEAMDFIGFLCAEIEANEMLHPSHASESARLAEGLRALMPGGCMATEQTTDECPASSFDLHVGCPPPALLAEIVEGLRIEAFLRAQGGDVLHWVTYIPDEECFFKGEDPFFTVRQTPELLWGAIVVRETWPTLAELNAYRCVLAFHLLTAGDPDDLAEHYRYVSDQVRVVPVDPLMLVLPTGDPNGGPVYEDFITEALHHLESKDFAALKLDAQTMLELSNPELWLSSALRWLLVLLDSKQCNLGTLRTLIESLRQLTPPKWAETSLAPEQSGSLREDLAPQERLDSVFPTPGELEQTKEESLTLEAVVAAQRKILLLDDKPLWLVGRLQSVAAVLIACCKSAGLAQAQTEIEAALQLAVNAHESRPLLTWLDESSLGRSLLTSAICAPSGPERDLDVLPTVEARSADEPQAHVQSSAPSISQAGGAQPEISRFGRRADDTLVGPLKVDQAKIDRLMNLIGEMVVSKNALPYLAQRAEQQYGVRDLAREIKTQYAVINRIAEEMQDAIMQVRMRPVSFVFQRFPRLVRDISNKVGKKVQLVLEGEETEADKNIIESLADPLIHIVRNSLDHGLETPDVRLAAGKPETGTLTIRASQEADRVLIDIMDDGKGIDPTVIKRKAYGKGVIDEATLERLTDREAVNLVFVAGFSTAEEVSDLSGRGVGMDVVRSAVEKASGSIHLESVVGGGTHIRISLPLSMAVTKVMIVESDKQFFGVPMDYVVETVRVPRASITAIKQSRTTVLRGQIIALKALNRLLDLSAEPKANADDELAVLVARVGSDVVGLLVDDFRETIDIIQKPLSGVLSGLSAYSGSALMGDGSVLMVLNVKEIV